MYPYMQSLTAHKSYWPYALEYYTLEPVKVILSQFRCIDHYWRSIGAILNEDGKPKYVQLYQLAKCVLSVFHGNAVPERCFSIKKKIIEARGNSFQEETIFAIRRGLCSSTSTDDPDPGFCGGLFIVCFTFLQDKLLLLYVFLIHYRF